MFELSITTRFSAAHHLVDYPGACAALHGHNWGVEVFVRGKELDETGILLDFGQIKEVVRRVIGEIDHTDLNTFAGLAGDNPSSENIARYLYRILAKELNSAQCKVHRVCVNETPEARATYWEP